MTTNILEYEKSEYESLHALTSKHNFYMSKCLHHVSVQYKWYLTPTSKIILLQLQIKAITKLGPVEIKMLVALK